MNKIRANDVKELFTVEAINVDSGYVTLKGTAEKGSVRITFTEVIPDIEEFKARVAINMSHEAMIEFAGLLNQVIQMLQPPKQDVVENTEQPKVNVNDDPPILQ